VHREIFSESTLTFHNLLFSIRPLRPGNNPFFKTFKTKDALREEKREVLAGHRSIRALGEGGVSPALRIDTLFS